MKNLTFIFFLIPFISLAQLHHSMISGNSSSVEKYNVFVFQTVGQLSSIGNFNSSQAVVVQGFQQPFIRNIKRQPTINQNIITYPNPFISNLNIEFLNLNVGELEVNVYDISGRFIKSFFKKNFYNIIELDLQSLPSAEYIINVKGNGINYSTKIIKK